jgi:hypothetical protein
MKKKKKWTTKNTHVKKKNAKGTYVEPEKWYDKLGTWIVIAVAVALIILIALDNHIVGYDNFIGIPSEWVRSLFD